MQPAIHRSRFCATLLYSQLGLRRVQYLLRSTPVKRKKGKGTYSSNLTRREQRRLFTCARLNHGTRLRFDWVANRHCTAAATAELEKRMESHSSQYWGFVSLLRSGYPSYVHLLSAPSPKQDKLLTVAASMQDHLPTEWSVKYIP